MAERGGRPSTSKPPGPYFAISVALAALALFYLFATDLIELVRGITAWSRSYSVALPVLILTAVLLLLPGVLWVIAGEVEDVLRKWIDVSPDGPENYVREGAPQFGRKVEHLLKSPTVVTAASLFLVILLEAELLARGLDGLIERVFLLDGGWPTKPWTLVTSGLAHDGLVHYAGNIVVLLMVGPFVERKLGWTWWIGLFLVANAIGGLAQLGMSAPGTSVVGSSPGILALFVVALAEVPPTWGSEERSLERRVWVVGAVVSIMFLLTWLLVLTQSGESGIGHWSHLAGALVGIAAAGIRWARADQADA